MASPNIYSSGLNLAGTVFANGPATLQLDGATYLSGLVQWLDTIDGDNANPGNKPELPVATLAQAVTNSAANGVIVIGAGSSETIASQQALGLAGLSIFGCGTGSSRPRYTWSGSTSAMFDLSAAGVWLENLYFPATTGSLDDGRVQLSAASCHVVDCYFECGANDETAGVLVIAAANARISGCTLAVTAERPDIGCIVNSAVADVFFENCTFDGGSYGWGDYALKVTGAATRVRHRGTTFTNRSDLGHTVTATTYQLFGVDVGGTGNVLLTA